MLALRTASAQQRFDTWLEDWRRFHQSASIGGQLAVLDILASLVPDSPVFLLEEIEMLTRQYRHVAPHWSALRELFETTLWHQLPTIPVDQNEMPTWYPEAIYRLGLPYRWAALCVCFVDFLLGQFPDVDPAPFRPFQDWIVSTARQFYTDCTISSQQGAIVTVPSPVA